VLLLQFKILLPEGVDTINHLLDELDFRVTQTMLVGNVISVTSLAARLSAGTTGLEVELFAPGLQTVNAVLGPAGQVNVDGGTHASSQVGGAGVDVAELLGVLELLATFSLDRFTDSGDTLGEPLEDSLDVTSLLHGDDTELILLVDPDQEGLGFVVEDTTALGPVTLHTGNLQVGITRHEEEVVINQLLAGGLIHASQGVVFAGKIARELGKGVLHQSLNVDTLLLGDAGRKAETLDGTSDTDPSRVNGHIGFNVASDLAAVHVRLVGKTSREAMVLADEGVEDIGEVSVRVLITSIDTTMLVVELNGASNGLGQSETGSLGGDSGKLVPFFLGHVFGDKGVFGFDIGEGCHCFSADLIS